MFAGLAGGSVAGGAAGGLTAGLIGYNDALSKLLFGREPSELSADEKMLIANIVTLAGAATGGAVDGSAGVGSGASACRTEVEINALGALVQGGKFAAQGCSKATACRNALVEKGLGAMVGILSSPKDVIGYLKKWHPQNQNTFKNDIAT